MTVLGAGAIAVSVTHLHHPPPRQPTHAFGVVPMSVSAQPAAATTEDRTPAAAAHVVNGGGVPLRLRIIRLKINAPVVPVRSAHRAIQVPTTPTTLGWWIGGATPGSLVGSTVIVGHVDSATRGLGALFHLDRIQAGDKITVLTTGNHTQSYHVTALRSINKKTGLTNRELNSGGPARLLIITCGGAFNERTKSYDSNIVAFADPNTH